MHNFFSSRKFYLKPFLSIPPSTFCTFLLELPWDMCLIIWVDSPLYSRFSLYFPFAFPLSFVSFLPLFLQISNWAFSCIRSTHHSSDIQWFSDTGHTGRNANVGYLLVNKDFLLGFYFPRASLAPQLLSHWATELSYDLSVLVRGQNMLIVPGFFVVETRFLVWFLFFSQVRFSVPWCSRSCLWILVLSSTLSGNPDCKWRARFANKQPED